MITELQKIKFILELIRRTAKDEVVWEITSSPTGLSPIIVDLSYITVFKDRTFRIFKYKSNYKNSDTNIFDGKHGNVRLELIDENNNARYEFPYDYSLITLYDLIQEKNSDIMGLFETILQEN